MCNSGVDFGAMIRDSAGEIVMTMEKFPLFLELVELLEAMTPLLKQY